MQMMTRKHFVLIAHLFKSTKPDASNTVAMRQWESTVMQFVHAGVTMNPRFNATRFLKACDLWLR